MSGSNPQPNGKQTGGTPQPGLAHRQTWGERLWDLADYTVTPWGMFTIFLILVLGTMLLFSDVVGPALQPLISLRVGGWMALICTVVIAFYIYALRREAHRYTYTRSFTSQRRLPLATLALAAFALALAIGFILAFGLTAKEEMIAPPGIEKQGMLTQGEMPHMVLKLAMTGLFTLGFILLTVSAGLMAAFQYGQKIDDDSSDAPLYTDEKRLTDRVLRMARKELQLEEALVTVSDMRRRGDGGIALLLHHTGELVEEGDTLYREDRTWLIEANYTGELIRVQETETRQENAEAFRVQVVLREVARVLNTTVASLSLTRLERRVLKPSSPARSGSSEKKGTDEDVEFVLHVSLDEARWVAVADRWNRLVALGEEGTFQIAQQPAAAQGARDEQVGEPTTAASEGKQKTSTRGGELDEDDRTTVVHGAAEIVGEGQIAAQDAGEIRDEEETTELRAAPSADRDNAVRRGAVLSEEGKKPLDQDAAASEGLEKVPGSGAAASDVQGKTSERDPEADDSG